jgi:gluconate 2-dehydrogenase gamma chain
MHRRDLFRRAAAAAAAVLAESASAREFPPDYDASKLLSRSDWKPVFLDAHQNETLIALSDLIIPATDTPGAREAQVNRFIDAIMAVESAKAQRDFLNALAFLDGESLDRYKNSFVHASRQQQLELLSYLAYPQSLSTWGGSVEGRQTAHRHFTTLKDWISRAYYSSEVGERELGSTGEFPHGDYAGCGGAAAPQAGDARISH